MANWNEIKKSAVGVAKTTIRKTGELAENATMQMKLTTLRAKRDDLYKNLGKLTYKQLKLGTSQAESIFLSNPYHFSTNVIPFNLIRRSGLLVLK